MRHSIALIVLASATILAGCAGQPAASSPTDGDARASTDADAAPIAAPSATLAVQGLSCPLCASNVDKQLMKVAGVRSVRVDLGTGTVRVDFADGARPSAAQLRRAVEDSGYSLVSISTP